MTDLMQALYDYTRNYETNKYLAHHEFHMAETNIISCQEKLLQEFPELYPQLDALLCEMNLSSSLEHEAIFQAAFYLGIKLSKL